MQNSNGVFLVKEQLDIPTQALSIIEWLRLQVSDAKAKGVVYGLSGGLDSALVGALCQRAFPKSSLALVMPCHSMEQDMKDARLLADSLGLCTKIVVLDQVYDLLCDLIDPPEIKLPAEKVQLTLANIKPRLRMTVLYYYASLENYLVVGGSNRSEIAVGYFTKYGDGGSDLFPLGNLVKSQVREMAEYLDVPREIIAKPPSAGLWENQTDEQEMGFSYEILDHYLLGGNIPEEFRSKIRKMQMLSEHKRRRPPIPD